MARAHRLDYIKACDIFGDVHGCYDELVELLTKLGHIARNDLNDCFDLLPVDRHIIFVGDLNDRGPASDKVFELVMWLYEQGRAKVVCGNHDNKLFRHLKGNKVKLTHGLQGTVDQLNARSAMFRLKVLAFLKELPYMIETQELIVVHGAYVNTDNVKAQEAFSYYGITDGSKDEQGFLIRDESWKHRYKGDKHVVHGHIPLIDGNPSVVVSPSGKQIINVDTACPYGGNLTAVAYPGFVFTQVPAKRAYYSYGPKDDAG
jgi:protein phosphatase